MRFLAKHKVQKASIGESFWVFLPKEYCKKHKIKKGDSIILMENEKGQLIIEKAE